MNKSNNDLIIRSATKGAGYFTQICNEFLRDPDIPFDEKGFLAYLLTFSGNWRITFAHILASNNTVKLKGLRSLFRRLEKRKFVAIIPQRRNERGVYENPVVIASDDREIVKRRHEAMIAGTAQEIADAMDAHAPQPPTPEGNPVDAEPPTPQRQAARRQAATAPLRISRLTNNGSKEKISLSPDASAAATAGERENAFELFEQEFKEFRNTGAFPNDGNWKAARNAFANLTWEGRQRAIGSAVLEAEEVIKRNLANNRLASDRTFATRVHNWFAKDGHKHPDGLAEYVPGLPGVKRSTLVSLLDAYFTRIHEWHQSAPWQHSIPFDQIPADLIAEVETPIKQRADEKAAAERAEAEDACRDPRVRESVIQRLCSFLFPRIPQSSNAKGFKRGDWCLRGPNPDERGCWYSGEILREAQRRNINGHISEEGQQAIEWLAKVQAGTIKWDAVRMGEPPGHPDCLIDPAILEQVEALSARAA